jgi:signal transduction histidine kinase
MDKGVEEHVKASLTASKSLIYVINDLLDITKSEESDSRMHEEPFSLQGLMLEVLGVFAMEAERKGLKLSFSSDTAHLPGMIIGDPQRLRQAISNILSNSVEYSDYGNIDIKVQSLKITNNTLSEFSFDITIRDEGEGMSEEHLDMLFHQFENILDEDDKSSAKNNDSATSSHQIGLGLAIVARFVCNSSGQMKIQTKKGVGTQVSLRLPMRTASAELSIKTPLLTPPTDMEATGIVWGRTTLETSGKEPLPQVLQRTRPPTSCSR